MSAVSIGLADSIRKKLKEGGIKLPSLPETVSQVQKRMNVDDYTVGDIASIISRDPAIATIILRMANSACFNPGGQEIRSLQTAIGRIGTNTILKLLISVSCRMMCRVTQPELRRLVADNQEHALLVAAGAERIARISQAADPADTFMAGLLHDQGKDVLIMAVPVELLQIPADERQPLLRQFHREMGARLLHQWGLPKDFILVVQHHGIESPDRPRLSILDCVDVADAMVLQMQSGEDAPDTSLFGQLPAARRLRLNEAHIAGVIVDIEDSIEDLKRAFAV